MNREPRSSRIDRGIECSADIIAVGICNVNVINVIIKAGQMWSTHLFPLVRIVSKMCVTLKSSNHAVKHKDSGLEPGAGGLDNVVKQFDGTEHNPFLGTFQKRERSAGAGGALDLAQGNKELALPSMKVKSWKNFRTKLAQKAANGPV